MVGAVLVFFALSACAACALVLAKRNPAAVRTGDRPTALVLARDAKPLLRSKSGDYTSLGRCLHELGFSVRFVRSLAEFPAAFAQFTPGTVAVDVELEKGIIDKVDIELLARGRLSETLVIFYNIADPATARYNIWLHNAYYLGTSISDSEIWAIASRMVPLRAAAADRKPFRETRLLSALEGKVQEGTVAELFQFMAQGDRTGALFVENHGRQEAAVSFEKGVMRHASTPTRYGVAAATETLGMKSGYFRISLGRPYGETNCSERIVEVLLAWAKSLDESDSSAAADEDIAEFIVAEPARACRPGGQAVQVRPMANEPNRRAAG